MADDWTWEATSEFVAAKGFTEHFCLGSCGGAGLGSSHVFVRPESVGKPIKQLASYATLSCVEGRWLVSIHESPIPKRPSHLSICGGTDYGDDIELP